MNLASADVGLGHTEIAKGGYELTQDRFDSHSAGRSGYSSRGKHWGVLCEIDPPPIILAINPASTGDAPDSQEG